MNSYNDTQAPEPVRRSHQTPDPETPPPTPPAAPDDYPSPANAPVQEPKLPEPPIRA